MKCFASRDTSCQASRGLRSRKKLFFCKIGKNVKIGISTISLCFPSVFACFPLVWKIQKLRVSAMRRFPLDFEIRKLAILTVCNFRNPRLSHQLSSRHEHIMCLEEAVVLFRVADSCRSIERGKTREEEVREHAYRPDVARRLWWRLRLGDLLRRLTSDSLRAPGKKK